MLIKIYEKIPLFLNNKKRLVINSDFFLQPQEVTFRAFSVSLKLIGEKYYSVRGKKLEKIIREVENNRLNRAHIRWLYY